MKKEFIVNRQGKDFVLFAGLLDQAHREGLKRISTKLVQAPADENGHMAIVWAEVEVERGVFSGIGDATPENVGRMIAPHLLRMAETRAKARALRDAINVGVTALEELGDVEEDSSMPGRFGTPRGMRPMAAVPRQTTTQTAMAVPMGHGATEHAAGSTASGATPQQIDRLHKLLTALGRPAVVADDLTSEAAATQIGELVRIFNAQSRGTGGRMQAR